MKEKAFAIIFNGLSIFLKGEGPTLRDIIPWKNEKDWTQAFLIKVIEWVAMPLCLHY